MEFSHISSVPTPSVLSYYWNMIVDDLPGAAWYWNFSALEFVSMAFVRCF